MNTKFYNNLFSSHCLYNMKRNLIKKLIGFIIVVITNLLTIQNYFYLIKWTLENVQLRRYIDNIRNKTKKYNFIIALYIDTYFVHYIILIKIIQYLYCQMYSKYVIYYYMCYSRRLMMLIFFIKYLTKFLNNQ